MLSGATGGATGVPGAGARSGRARNASTWRPRCSTSSAIGSRRCRLASIASGWAQSSAYGIAASVPSASRTVAPRRWTLMTVPRLGVTSRGGRRERRALYIDDRLVRPRQVQTIVNLGDRARRIAQAPDRALLVRPLPLQVGDLARHRVELVGENDVALDDAGDLQPDDRQDAERYER